MNPTAETYVPSAIVPRVNHQPVTERLVINEPIATVHYSDIEVEFYVGSDVDESEDDDGSDENFGSDQCPDSLSPNCYIPPDSSKKLPPFAVTELAAASSSDYTPSTWRSRFADNPIALDYIATSIANRPLHIEAFEKYLPGYWDLEHLIFLLTHGIKLIHFDHHPEPYHSDSEWYGYSEFQRTTTQR